MVLAYLLKQKVHISFFQKMVKMELVLVRFICPKTCVSISIASFIKLVKIWTNTFIFHGVVFFKDTVLTICRGGVVILTTSKFTQSSYRMRRCNQYGLNMGFASPTRRQKDA